MSLSAEDVESTARRAGWSLAEGRAAQIASTAGPRVQTFQKVRERLEFDDDAEGFARALLETAGREGGQ